MPPLDDLLRSRRQLAAGVGQTTRRNRVLPFTPLAVQIPARVGTAIGAPPAAARGFIAKDFAESFGQRFDPYTLATLGGPYYVPAGAHYAVQSFATTFNVADTTEWHDTIAFFAKKIYVNARPMGRLGIPVALLSAPAIPYLIADATPGEPYGNATLNGTEKRVFAVGRYQVQSWGGGGMLYTLTPTTPRADGKAMTIGQRTDPATHKASLAQLYFTGTDWDSLAGAWAFSSVEVSMLLTAPYLSAVTGSATIDQPPCTLASIAGSSPSSNTPTALPSVELCAVGVGEAGASTFTPEGLFTMFQWVRWPCRETFSYQVPGSKDITGTAANWSASASQNNTMAGRTIAYTAANSLSKTSHSETFTFSAFSAPLFASVGGGTPAVYDGNYYSSSGGYHTWGAVTGDLSPRDANGQGDYDHTSGNVGASAAYTSATQSGSSTATLGATALVSVTFSRYKESGNKVTPTPISGRFAADLADPYRWTLSGSGFYESASGLQVRMTTTDPLHGNVVGKRQPLITAKVNEIAAAGKFYDNVNAYNSSALYTGAVSARATLDNQVLNWTTIDYLLYDATNSVYISIEGEFVGSQAYGGSGTATLTVRLKVQTRHHTNTLTLSTTDYTYSELLPEQSIGGGHSAVPSPKIRAIFAPLYQEQGSFHGAHYVTLAEETAGAAPAHLFYFLLALRTYAGLGTLNDDNESAHTIGFVPCNLLEMLYAYVFSQAYGIDPSNRYPVTFGTRYSDLITALFTTPTLVAIRDGTAADWTPSIATSDAGLYRT